MCQRLLTPDLVNKQTNKQKNSVLEDLRRKSTVHCNRNIDLKFQKLFSFYEFYTAKRPKLPAVLKQSLFKDPKLNENKT